MSYYFTMRRATIKTKNKVEIARYDIAYKYKLYDKTYERVIGRYNELAQQAILKNFEVNYTIVGNFEPGATVYQINDPQSQTRRCRSKFMEFPFEWKKVGKLIKKREGRRVFWNIDYCPEFVLSVLRDR